MTDRRSHPARVACIVMFIDLVVAGTGGAQVPVRPQVEKATPVPVLQAMRIPDGARPPVIDGRVNEELWLKAEAFADFVQQQPDEGRLATERTEVRIAYDHRAIYIGIVCFDREPGKIIAVETHRDDELVETDAVQVVLDTFNDHQNAFLFGTNPLGVEYDGQVASEGLLSGSSGGGQAGFGMTGSQRGQVLGFNKNWDGDWTVKSQITDRGWETEMRIPLKTLRYAGGQNRTWGMNVLRNIRRKNEQSYMSPIPRAFDIFRVSLAASLSGLDLPARRDIRATPFVVTGFTGTDSGTSQQTDGLHDVGMDVKWGVTPNLTADFTVKTDFAQVEADEEQINFTRFDLFFPEKRPFFLENAAMFQFGQPQQIDLFFSRRIGLSSAGQPIGILGGGRLSGVVGKYKVGLLNMQTEETTNTQTGALIVPPNNFTVSRVQRQFGRSDVGAIFVDREGTGVAAGANNFNRAYGVDANLQLTQNSKLFAFIARSTSPGTLGSDFAGRAYYDFKGKVWEAAAGYTEVGDRFNAEAGFVPRVGYRKPEASIRFNLQPRKKARWIRNFDPHASFQEYYGFDGREQSRLWHIHPFEIWQSNGGRFGYIFLRYADRPAHPFVAFTSRDGRQVVIPPRGLYEWHEHQFHFATDASKRLSINSTYNVGGYYDGTHTILSLDSGIRLGARFQGAVGYIRTDADLPYGTYSTDLLRVRTNYAFTTKVSLQALVQYNTQSAQVLSNIRFAWLARNGTGLFVVYNDTRDTYDLAPSAVPNRTFVVKYARLFEF